MKTRVVSIDFETFYDSSGYSLRKMTMPEYVYDPRFQIIGVAVSVNGGEPEWFSADNILAYRAWLHKFELEKENTITIAHNAMFDGAILEWHLGIKPWRYFCTMMGSRPTVAPFTGRMSLDSCSEFLGLGVKGKEVLGARDMRLADFSGKELARYAAYCCNDVVLCWRVFRKLIKDYPLNEIRLLDLTIKKFTRPRIKLDVDVIDRGLAAEAAEKAKLLAEAGLEDKDALMSNPKFADLLINYGANPPQKISPTTGKTTWAFAKSDPAFMALTTCGVPKIEALAKARIKFKSTLVETRLQKLRRIALAHPDKLLPAALLYYGAHPGRFSGYDGTNLQNLPRGSLLRECLVAPEGYKIVAADLSQIEARITAWLAGEWGLVNAFAKYDAMPDTDRDVYCEFGDKVYMREITKKDESERFVSKQGVLSLQYQAGAEKFRSSLKERGVDMPAHAADAVVQSYRQTYKNIVGLWNSMEGMKKAMLSGANRKLGPLTAHTNRIKLPNGMFLTYPELTAAGRNWKYRFGREWRTIYGGKLTENCVQALARIVMTTAELKLAKHGLHAALSVHDELVFVVKDENVEPVCKAVEKALCGPVPWAPELPVACEIGVGDSYGTAK